jgi:tetratricopeptide (TPR) repeat protein
LRKLISLVAAALAACLPAAAQAEWREASSKHFLVYSEGSAQSVQDFATKLEKFDKAMRLRLNLGEEDLGPANRVIVYVVDDIGEVRRLARARGSDVAGFYSGRAGGSIAVTPRRSGTGALGDLDPATILLHEYSHHLMMQNAAVAYPAWFREGFAEFYSTARFEKDGSIGFGAAANHRAWGLLGLAPLPIELLFDPTKKKLSPAEWEATIYGRGWLLTHYLFFAPERKGQLRAYIDALNSGKGSLEAARGSFGDLKKLDRELKVYLAQKTLPYLKLLSRALIIEPVAVRTLRPGEAAIIDLRIRSDVGVTKVDAARVAKEMRAKAAPYPNDPAVQAALAEAEYDAENFDAAEAAADRAIAADAKNVNALLYKARVRMARAEKAASDDPAPWKDIRRLVIQANRADPNNPEPLMLFYSSFQSQGVPPTRNAVDGLVQAFELAPQDLGLRISVARQHLVDGNVAAARRALAPIAFDPHGGEMGQAIAGVIAKLDEKGAKAALEEWDEAIKAAEDKAAAEGKKGA